MGPENVETSSTINQQPQSPFFRIPLEIRFAIYKLWLGDNETTLPTGPDQANQVPRFQPGLRQGPRPRYPLTYQRPTSCILSSCRKINAELRTVQQSLDIMRKEKPPACKLDLIITPRYALPTWIVAPVHVDGDVEYDLDVSLRFFDVSRVTPLFASDGWIGTLSYPLMAILNKLVHHGPRFRTVSSPNAKHNRPLRFNTITINLKFPGNFEEGPGERRSRPPALELLRWALRAMRMFMSYIVSRGLLYGKVREIIAYSTQMDQSVRMKVTQRTVDEEELAMWIRDGFVWGPDSER